MITQELQQELKVKLEETKASLEQEIEELSAPIDMGDDVDGGDEEADEAEETANHLGAVQALKERLSEVERALQKMEDGTYGVCEELGTPIDEATLRANPETRYSKEHKLQERE